MNISRARQLDGKEEKGGKQGTREKQGAGEGKWSTRRRMENQKEDGVPGGKHSIRRKTEYKEEARGKNGAPGN